MPRLIQSEDLDEISQSNDVLTDVQDLSKENRHAMS
jgi:hypothetical protein